MLIFESLLTEGIAQLSYLVGDTSTGSAAVVDPRPDVDVYLEMAERHGVSITHVLETHIHADFMSGARELAHRTGTAKIYCSHEGEPSYGFEHEAIRDGTRFPFGKVALTTRHTPGHTPEHVSFELAENDRPDEPWGVLTGDSLFVGSAGRPDLLGEQATPELTEKLFQTLKDYYLRLDDGVMIYPCHGAGSACGADIGERPASTIGHERRGNPFLQFDDLERFQAFIEEGAPPVPSHYPKLKKVNGQGPPVLGNLPGCPGLPPQSFQEKIDQGRYQLLDVRHMLAFGGGHIAGAVNIGDRAELSVWAADMLESEVPTLLVLHDDTDRDRVLRLLLRTGVVEHAGYLAGGMTAWANTGRAMQRLPQRTVQELHDNRGDFEVLDVRSDGEWRRGHIPGARHCFVGTLRDSTPELDRDKPLVTYCASGYRASIAASLLQSRGFNKVHNVPGSWQAWTSAGYPVEE
ncbi:MAG: MBL fold metallo-hydrolase [Planctomycetaceae bacterium]|nr:MAG: MBL fold metallo-hydrolase [Planctomycetaceae bacterium]